MFTEKQFTGKQPEDELKQKVNLKDYLISEGAIFTESDRTQCLFCGSQEVEVKFVKKKGFWMWGCHSCREAGTIIRWVMKKYGLSREDAVVHIQEKIRALNGVEEKPEELREEQDTQEEGEKPEIEEDEIRQMSEEAKPECNNSLSESQDTPSAKIKKKKPRKGYESFSGFVKLENMMMESASWTSLSERAVWLYVMTLRQYRYAQGGNNHLVLPYSKVEWKMSKGSFSRAMKELVRYGFLRLVEQGGIGHKPSVYAVSNAWKGISREIVDKEGREAIRLGLAQKKRSWDRSLNLKGKGVKV